MALQTSSNPAEVAAQLHKSLLFNGDQCHLQNEPVGHVTENSVYGGFDKWGYPHSWMVYMEKLIKMDDSGVPPFQETYIEHINLATS